MKSNPNAFALRVDLNNRGLTELTPSYHLGTSSVHVHPDKLPEFITQPLAILKMLSDGERVEDVGKKYNDGMYYVFVDADMWKAFVADSYTDFLLEEGEEK